MTSDDREAALQRTLDAIASDARARLCLAARDLRSGRSVSHHANSKCPTASVIKLPVLIHTLMLAQEGIISLTDEVELRDEDKKPGSGVLKELTAGLRLPLRDACMLMMAVSDNTATNLVLDVVSIEGVNTRMQQLGCKATRLFRKVFSEGPPVSRENARYGLGVTTPRDMLHLLTSLFRGDVGGDELAVETRRYLAAQQYRDAIPRFLPTDWQYEGKGGAVDAARNDVGYVIAPDGTVFALAVFCNGLPQTLWTPDNPGLIAIARAARAVCAYLRPDLLPASQDVPV